MNNGIIKIVQDALDNEYKFGVNDCNIIVLRVIDLIANTEWSKIAEYKNVKAGIKQLNTLGFNSTQDIVTQHCDEVSIVIDGDIWLDPENPLLMGVMVSGRLLGVNEEHNGFVLINKPKDGKFYRTRKVNNG